MMHLDRAGRLWVSTPEGTAFPERRPLDGVSAGRRLDRNQARYFAERIRASFYGHHFFRDPAQVRRRRLPAHPVSSGDPSEGVFPHVDERGVLWAVTPKYIGKFVDSHWEETVSIAAWKDESLLCVGSSRDHGIWIVTKERIRKYRGGDLVLNAPGPKAHFEPGPFARIPPDRFGVDFSKWDLPVHSASHATGPHVSPVGRFRAGCLASLHGGKRPFL